MNFIRKINSGLAGLLLSATLFSSNLSAEEYKVSKGDTYSSISKEVGVPVSSLIKSNPKINPRRLKVGQVIIYSSSKPTIRIGNESNRDLRVSDDLIKQIASFESFSPKVYDDFGHPAIGYGHRLLPGESFTNITKEQALELKRKDIKKIENAVKAAVKVPLDRNEYDGLVSLGYNLGPSGISNSEVVTHLNNSNYIAAADAFVKYNTSKGKVLRGLSNRRQKEIGMFLGLD